MTTGAAPPDLTSSRGPSMRARQRGGSGKGEPRSHPLPAHCDAQSAAVPGGGSRVELAPPRPRLSSRSASDREGRADGVTVRRFRAAPRVKGGRVTSGPNRPARFGRNHRMTRRSKSLTPSNSPSSPPRPTDPGTNVPPLKSRLDSVPGRGFNAAPLGRGVTPTPRRPRAGRAVKPRDRARRAAPAGAFLGRLL